MTRAAAFVGMSMLSAQVSAAHHGGGTFDNTREIELSGILTRIDSPHSWI